MPVSTTIILDAVPRDSQMFKKMIVEQIKLDHCDRTDNPSTFVLPFQNPTSFLNAKNENHECMMLTINVATNHRQS